MRRRQGVDLIGILPFIYLACPRSQFDCFFPVAKRCIGTGRAKPGSVIQRVGVVRSESHCGDEVVLRSFELTEMKISIPALTSASPQTPIILSQVNRTCYGINRFLVAMCQIVDNAGVVVAKVKLRLDPNYLEKII